MFCECSFILVYIFRVSLVTITQSYQILEKVLNCLPPVLSMVPEETWYE